MFLKYSHITLISIAFPSSERRNHGVFNAFHVSHSGSTNSKTIWPAYKSGLIPALVRALLICETSLSFVSWFANMKRGPDLLPLTAVYMPE